MRVEVARNGTPGECVKGVKSDPASRGVGEFTGGKEGGELRKFGIETVHFTFNTKGLGGREEKDVIIIWWANRGRRRAVPAFWKLPFVFQGFYEGFQVFKGFHGLFFKKGDATRKPKSRRISGVVIERIFSLEKPGME